MQWIAFFSQTGSEIVNVSKEIRRKPDLIITNNLDETTYDSGIKDLGSEIKIGKHDELMDYLRQQETFRPIGTMITLHGYLRILPKDICEEYNIINGHPGLINQYPELKGKDPQVRAWEGRYENIGSVVHKVTPEVDEGEVKVAVWCTNTASSLDEMYGLLKRTSLQSWISLLKKYPELGCELV